ncbi:hypothetical protein [Patulibacter americanus]|uniref:hypothetical protein n=1 Tax=Patulibacter americanus TaxID=588672 RepID=UPI0012FA911B|nr:hypothetical protein [Patulibacter americanus]
MTRRTVLTAPGNADDFEGAGRFVAWKVGSSRWGWDAMRVVERDTGRRRYSLPLRRIMDAVGRKTGDDAPWPDVATLTPGGTVDLHVFYYARRLRPVFVDERGRVRRLEATFRDATAFTTRVRGGRVLVSAESDGDPRDGCVRTSSWLTDRTGRVGTTFRTVRATKRLRLSNDPVFVSPTAILWGEQNDNGGPFPYRYRVLPDARDLPLTTGGRPAC